MAAIYWFCSDEQFQPEEIVRQSKLAEDVGFDGIMISEHFHPWVEDKGTAGFAFSTLGAIAETTHRVKLLTAVTAPLFRYHPAVVAQAAATIDRLSGGRFELGVGTGENINEGPLGFTLPAYKERQLRLSEARQIIRSLLDGEKLSFEGKYYQTKFAKLYSPPISKVPIYMAAGGPQSATTAGKNYEGIIVSVKDINETITNTIKPAKASTEIVNFKTVALRWTVLGKDESESWQAIQPQRGLRAPSRDTATDPLTLQQEADRLNRKDILNKYTIVKDVDDYFNAYAPLISEIKADIVGIQTTSLNQMDTIELLGRELLPRLRKLN